MRILLFLIGIILLSFPALAIYGGDSETVFHFNECSSLKVNVSASLPIEDGEYNFIDCTLIGNNSWSCNCSNGFDLIINTTLQTLNNYEIIATYEYEKKENIVQLSGGSGLSGINNWICYEWLECIDGKQEQICELGKVTKKNLRECKVPETVGVQEESSENNNIEQNSTQLPLERTIEKQSNETDTQTGFGAITGRIIQTTTGKTIIGIIGIIIIIVIFVIGSKLIKNKRKQQFNIEIP